MVTEYGMSSKLGAVKYGTEHGDPFLGRTMGNQADYSHEVARDIDDEVRKLIEAAHTEAWEILTEYRDVLDTLAGELLEKETLHRAELQAIFADVEKRPRLTVFDDFGGRDPVGQAADQDARRAGDRARRAVAAAGARAGLQGGHRAGQPGRRGRAQPKPTRNANGANGSHRRPTDPARLRRPAGWHAPGWPPSGPAGLLVSARSRSSRYWPQPAPVIPASRASRVRPRTTAYPALSAVSLRRRSPLRTPEGLPSSGRGREPVQATDPANTADERTEASDGPSRIRAGSPRSRRTATRAPVFDQERAEAAIRELLFAIGEDPDRDGLQDTPARVARAYREMFAGLYTDPDSVLNTTFDEDHDEMVMVKEIPLYSTCEHHLVSFHGVAHVGYIPGKDGRVTGLSKIARLVDLYAKRPQVQERLTSQIADALMRKLDPRGVIVVVEAEHLCMAMRGVRKPGAVTTTSAVRGQFKTSAASRAEALDLILRK